MTKRMKYLVAGLTVASASAAGLLVAAPANAAELHNDLIGTYWGTLQQTPFVECQSEAARRNQGTYGTTRPTGDELFYCASGSQISYNLWWAHYR